MNQQIGKQSLRFSEAPFLISSASIGGPKEGEGPLGDAFDAISEDGRFGEKTWEMSESTMQKEVLTLALGKAGIEQEEVRYLFAGDLLGQTMATSFAAKEIPIPLFGLYGACSTAGEALMLAAMSVAAGYANLVGAMTSSHFGSAEKQFRFPLEYAQQKPMSTTWTVTGAGAFLLGKQKSNVKITEVTTGRVVDYGVKDALNMGAAMAPAACDTIASHIYDFDRNPSEYDAIVTGDLGKVGQEILFHLLEEKGIDISAQHQDCGLLIYDCEEQQTDSGGSGCGCSAVTLCNYFLPRLMTGEMKKILFVPTGAMISKISFNEGLAVPGIAHAVVLEHVKKETK